MTTTLVVSDLHVGDRARADVLRREGVAGALLDAVEQVDRLVILGDALELRNRPARDVLAAAEPVYRALGEALAGKPLVIVAGNHDHALVERFLARNKEPLGLEQRFGPKKASTSRSHSPSSSAGARMSSSPIRACGCARTSMRRTGTTSTCT